MMKQEFPSAFKMYSVSILAAEDKYAAEIEVIRKSMVSNANEGKFSCSVVFNYNDRSDEEMMEMTDTLHKLLAAEGYMVSERRESGQYYTMSFSWRKIC